MSVQRTVCFAIVHMHRGEHKVRLKQMSIQERLISLFSNASPFDSRHMSQLLVARGCEPLIVPLVESTTVPARSSGQSNISFSDKRTRLTGYQPGTQHHSLPTLCNAVIISSHHPSLQPTNTSELITRLDHHARPACRVT